MLFIITKTTKVLLMSAKWEPFMNTVQDIAQTLLKQRKSLAMDQKDMLMRIGMTQQQYQRIEGGSDVKLSTLLRVLEGLNLELSITPRGSQSSQVMQSNEKLHEPNNEFADDAEDLDFWFKSE